MKHPNQVVKRFQSSLLQCRFFFSIVLLITGGLNYGAGSLRSVEIFDPSNDSLSCSLPSMVRRRNGPASVGMTVCGGYDDRARKTCETLHMRTGQWRLSHTLKEERVYHMMWRTPSDKIMVMGGVYNGTLEQWNNETTTLTEVLKDDGSSEYSFDLKHKTRYVY